MGEPTSGIAHKKWGCLRRLRNYLNHPRFRRRSDATLLRPMRPSSFAVGICPFPDLSIIVLQDDNYYSPCVRCTRAAGLWIAYLYLYRLKEVLRGPPDPRIFQTQPVYSRSGSRKRRQSTPFGQSTLVQRILWFVVLACQVYFLLLIRRGAWYLPHTPVVLLRTHRPRSIG